MNRFSLWKRLRSSQANLPEPSTEEILRAQALEERLRHPDATSAPDAALKPLESMARAIERVAEQPTDAMDVNVARSQKAMLLALATKQQSVAPSVAPSRSTGSWFPRPSVFAGGFAMVMAVILLAVVVRQQEGNGILSPTIPSPFAIAPKVAKLVIPEASAGEAFDIVSEKSDRAGVDPTTTFLVKSKIPLETEPVAQHVKLRASADQDVVPVTVEKAGEQEWRVTPQVALKPGTSYQVSVTADVTLANGEARAKEYSWAIQTKESFQLRSMTPASGGMAVPVTTALEFVWSASGWDDPSSFFAIEPKVSGRFETRGRSLVFLPSAPLKYGQLYTVTLQKGFGIAGTEQKLTDSVKMQFETEVAPRDRAGSQIGVEPTLHQLSVATGKEPLIPVILGFGIPANVALKGYALSGDRAEFLLRDLATVPLFAQETRRTGDFLKKYLSGPTAFESSGRIVTKEYQNFLALPSTIAPGYYAISIKPTDGKSSWVILSVTDVAATVIADRDSLMVWALSAKTNQPLAEVSVTLGSETVQTDARGLVKLKVPIGLATSTVPSIVRVGSGAQSVLIPVSGAGVQMPYWESIGVAERERTVSYLQADRPLYRGTDEAHIFGLIQDRASSKGVSTAQLKLYRNGFYDPSGSGSRTVFAEVDLTPDASGFFQASLPWSRLSPGEYQLAIVRDGTDVEYRDFQIQEFAKPAYSLQVTTQKRAVIAGEPIVGEVRATFFDGTPVANLALQLDASNVMTDRISLQTNANGAAVFQIKTEPKSCALPKFDARCGSVPMQILEVRPTGAEDATLFAQQFVSVWNAKLTADARAEIRDQKLTSRVTVREVDLSQSSTDVEGYTVLGAPVAGKSLKGVLYERRWVQTRIGERYDEVLKRSEPIYSYQVQETEKEQFDVLTDREGVAMIERVIDPSASYRIIYGFTDAVGQSEIVFTDAFPTSWSNYADSADYALQLVPTPEQVNRATFAPGESVKVRMSKGREELIASDAERFLFLEATNGIISSVVTRSPEHAFVMDAAHEPNTTVFGIHFTDGGFVTRSYTAALDASARGIELKLSADKESYAPGDHVELSVQASAKDGMRLANTKIGIAVVDEAVFAAARVSGDELPLDDLYAWIGDGITVNRSSHYAVLSDAGSDFWYGAEKGGGGQSDRPRTNLKDTATFQVVDLDFRGRGSLSFTLPENVTGWRATAVALDASRRAGVAKTMIPVTKPVVVDAVLPAVILVGDAPVLTLRTTSAGTTSDLRVTYAVEIPDLTWKSEAVTEDISRRPTVKLPNMPAGLHEVIIRAQTLNGSDAIVKRVQVVESRFRVPEIRVLDLAPGAALPDPGSLDVVRAIFVPGTRAKYLADLESLAGDSRPRAELRVAALGAQRSLKTWFGREVESVSLAGIQQANGGLAALPYAEAEVGLSSRLAAAAPTEWDRTALTRYFWEKLSERNATREQQMEALSGLAVMGEAVLPELQDVATRPDLNWRERLAISRGLFALGDRVRATTVLQQLLERQEVTTTGNRVKVSSYAGEIHRATAEAMVLAAQLELPEADALWDFVKSDGTSGEVDALERAAFIAIRIPQLPRRDAKIRIGIPEKIDEIVLTEGIVEKTYAASVWKEMRVVEVDGPVSGAMWSEATQIPESNSDLRLIRRYETETGKALTKPKPGDLIRVVLEPKFGPRAPEGCYQIRDFVPGGLMPIVDIAFTGFKDPTAWYPTDAGNGAVDFVTCRNFVPTISYTARVVSVGTYRAEPAVLQSLDRSEFHAVSAEAKFEVGE